MLKKMKILYLTPSHVDYLADQIYLGLCKIVGWENVVDFPYKRLYHDPTCNVPSIPQTPGYQYSFKEIVDMLQSRVFDWLVLAAIRTEPLVMLDRLAKTASLPPRILLDGDDGPEIREDLFERYRFVLYFKREFVPGEKAGLWRRLKGQAVPVGMRGRVFPLPFSAVLEAIPNSVRQEVSRDIDVSFVGIASHRKRIRAVDLLRRVPDMRFVGTIYADCTMRESKLAMGPLAIWKAKLQGDPYVSKEMYQRKLSWEAYWEVLARSKMGLSIRGAGYDTVRYWEIVAAKALLIAEQPDIDIPYNFEHGKQAIFIRPDLSDLVPVLKTYLQDHDAREAIAQAGYAHLLKYHTCEQRARQFLEICSARL